MPRKITKTFQSESTPGASFELTVLGRAVRHRAEVAIADQRHRYRLLMDRYRRVVLDPLTKKIRTTEELSGDERGEVDRMNIEAGLVDDEISMAYARTLLASFKLPEEWKEIQTVDDLFESGPEKFTEEIEARAKEMWKLTEQEIKNSASPTSSPSPEDGKMNDTTAITASSSDSTELETAA